MALVNYNVLFTVAPGSLGTTIEYKEWGAAAWIKPAVPTNPTMVSPYALALEDGKTYFIRLTYTYAYCPPQHRYLTVVVPQDGVCCPAGYTASPDGAVCVKEETVDPSITQSGVCLTASTHETYSGSGTRIYDTGYDQYLQAYTLADLLIGGIWQGMDAATGPLNREGVWLDSDCNGTKDTLAGGSQLQVSTTIDVLIDKVVYVGIAGDNTFSLDLQNSDGATTLLDVGAGAGTAVDGAPAANFNYWHVVPVQLRSGPNVLTFSATGDGSTNDAFGACVMDNTLVQLQAAASEADLTFLFRTRALRGQSADIATCPSGYTLDTSGGQGNYVCRRMLNTPPITC